MHDTTEGTRYVNAAKYPGPRNTCTLSVVDNEDKVLNIAMIKTGKAEEAAIELTSTTAQSHDEIVALSDSQTVCRQADAKSSPTCSREPTRGHPSLGGNEMAHATARELTHRA